MLESPDRITTTGVLLGVNFGAETSACRISTGGIEVSVPLSVFGDLAAENIASVPAADISTVNNLLVATGEHRTFGVCVLSVLPQSLRAVTREIYASIFSVMGERKLYRIWNYVPAINDDSSGLENYRAFNIGRSEAFADHFGGSGSWQFMPAASAVGNGDNHLVVIFLAGSDPVTYVENPEQVPAYRYPAQYGPKSPSFSRGATIENGSGQLSFISGTASIRGHQVVGKSNLSSQLATTTENLHLVADALGTSLVNGSAARFFKTYVRHEADFAKVRQYVAEHLSARDNEVVFLHTNICRSELDVEIEASIAL